jgi:hypothetical protein
MRQDGLTESPAGRWTRADDYVAALGRKRGARRRQRPARTEPEAPRFLLSTLPFVALLALLGVIALAIIIAAVPGAQPQSQVRQPAERQPAERQQGVAAKGWFQEAQKEFHR